MIEFPHTEPMEREKIRLWIAAELLRQRDAGKTQRGLAKALGIDPTGVSRILNGKRKVDVNEIPKVQEYLGPMPTALQHHETLTIPQSLAIDGTVEMLKVVGMAEGGPDGWNLWNGETVEVIRKPDNLVGVPGAYGVYVTGTSMEPRYHPSEILHIHPGKPVTPGCYVLVQRRNPDDEAHPLAVVKRLVRRSATKTVLAQTSPAREIEIRTDEIVSMHRVVGSSEA